MYFDDEATDAGSDASVETPADAEVAADASDSDDAEVIGEPESEE